MQDEKWMIAIENDKCEWRDILNGCKYPGRGDYHCNADVCPLHAIPFAFIAQPTESTPPPDSDLIRAIYNDDHTVFSIHLKVNNPPRMSASGNSLLVCTTRGMSKVPGYSNLLVAAAVMLKGGHKKKG